MCINLMIIIDLKRINLCLCVGIWDLWLVRFGLVSILFSSAIVLRITVCSIAVRRSSSFYLVLFLLVVCVVDCV